MPIAAVLGRSLASRRSPPGVPSTGDAKLSRSRAAAAEDDWGEAELVPGTGVAAAGLPGWMVPVPGIHGASGAGLLGAGPASPVW